MAVFVPLLGPLPHFSHQGFHITHDVLHIAHPDSWRLKLYDLD
jgi:hypothetical protein